MGNTARVAPFGRSGPFFIPFFLYIDRTQLRMVHFFDSGTITKHLVLRFPCNVVLFSFRGRIVFHKSGVLKKPSSQTIHDTV